MSDKKDDKNKKQEHNTETPEPPQVMKPLEPPVKKKSREKSPQTMKDRKKEMKGKPKLLGESETEIDDETTI